MALVKPLSWGASGFVLLLAVFFGVVSLVSGYCTRVKSQGGPWAGKVLPLADNQRKGVPRFGGGTPLPQVVELQIRRMGDANSTIFRRQPGQNPGPRNGVRIYTVAFDDKGVVIDVHYNEQGRHDGLTAQQVQRKVRGEGTLKGGGRAA
jgi:hypothetical protein